MTICIYHGNCADGFGAAWAVRHALGEQVRFVPGKYGEAPPDVTGETVYIVDFSYPLDVLKAMSTQAERIVLLDHHKSAAAALSEAALACPNVVVIFDMERSGARIAWDYFFSGVEPPMLLQHIEDRDLWRFELDGTREVQAGLFSYPYDFDVWTRLMFSDDALEALYRDGVAIERKHHKDVAELVKAFQSRRVIGGHDVPVVNLPYTMTSDAGHLMAKGEPFAACYWDTPSHREYSLRSDINGIDVSEVAKGYGGGGHRHAAGFRVTFDHRLVRGEA